MDADDPGNPPSLPSMQHASSAKGGRRAGLQSNGSRGALVVRAVRKVADLRVSAIVLVRRGSEVDALLAERSAQHPLRVVHDHHELCDARREISVASFFGVGDKAPVDVPEALDVTHRHWPGTRCVWFSQHGTPSFPRETFSAWIDLDIHGPLRDPVRTVALLEEQIQIGARRRRTDIEVGQAFAKYHGLKGRAEVLCVAIACGIPADRLGALVDKGQSGKLAKFCSEEVYPLVGVKCLLDLVSRVMCFRLSSTSRDCPAEEARASPLSG